MNVYNLSDFHIHTYFSSDSTSSPESMIKQAMALGLSSICFTDHNDLDFPFTNTDGSVLFLLDLESYKKEMTKLREKYSGIFDVYIGIEQGLLPHLADKTDSYGDLFPFDFIIGSSHIVNGNDPYLKEYWENISYKEGIERYFTGILETVKACANYDVYGHLDYVIRYAPGQDRDYRHEDYSKITDEIFTLLIQKGKGIEINTGGLKKGIKQPHPNLELLKRYKELGGEIITVGSDAHNPGHLAYAFDKIPEYLKTAGFDYYTIFKQRKPYFIKIK